MSAGSDQCLKAYAGTRAVITGGLGLIGSATISWVCCWLSQDMSSRGAIAFGFVCGDAASWYRRLSSLGEFSVLGWLRALGSSMMGRMRRESLSLGCSCGERRQLLVDTGESKPILDKTFESIQACVIANAEQRFRFRRRSAALRYGQEVLSPFPPGK